jgi:hypothetical protein
MQVLENTVAICKRVVEKQQPAHVEYKEQLTELRKKNQQN